MDRVHVDTAKDEPVPCDTGSWTGKRERRGERERERERGGGREEERRENRERYTKSQA